MEGHRKSKSTGQEVGGNHLSSKERCFKRRRSRGSQAQKCLDGNGPAMPKTGLPAL
jgi:hypothetical protein